MTIELESPFSECRVEWVDTCSIEGWHTSTELREIIEKGVVMIESLGWLVYRCDQFILLAMSASPESAGDLLVIPQSAIKDIFMLASNGSAEDANTE